MRSGFWNWRSSKIFSNSPNMLEQSSAACRSIYSFRLKKNCTKGRKWSVCAINFTELWPHEHVTCPPPPRAVSSLCLNYGTRLCKMSSNKTVTLRRVCADVTCCRGSSMKLDPVRRRSIFMGLVSSFSSSKAWGSTGKVNFPTFLIPAGKTSREAESGFKNEGGN